MRYNCKGTNTIDDCIIGFSVKNKNEQQGFIGFRNIKAKEILLTGQISPEIKEKCMAKKFEELTISDDFMFCVVMQNSRFCKKFL
jgi:hypothetical protein